MDVYLVPIGRERHELYCEVADEPDASGEGDAPEGFVRRMIRRFSAVLAEAERERRAEQVDDRPRSTFARAKAWTLRYVAESIAEQRLLWHLRRQSAACLFFPDDLEERHATALLKRQLARDFDKHRFWLIIDSLGFIASGLLFLVPGPNIVAYYFGFRMVGHYLSLRGARHGLDAVSWTSQPSAPLSELRRVIPLGSHERGRRVHDVAVALRLEHLVKFFERTAIQTST